MSKFSCCDGEFYHTSFCQTPTGVQAVFICPHGNNGCPTCVEQIARASANDEKLVRIEKALREITGRAIASHHTREVSALLVREFPVKEKAD